MSDQPTTTGNALDRIHTSGPPAPLEVGQATAIEQSRAFAEVQAAVYLAHQFPRDETVKRAQILDACNQLTLAERAFFSYSRGGSKITGPSIHFARELARIWGNIQYGLTELSRDDQRGSSQMIAYAWDLQTNARPSTTFITPHGMMARGELKALTDPRDVYENNANQGARRVREQILAVLPRWLVEEAKAACMETMRHGGGKPLAVRIEEMVAAYAKARVTLPQLEARVGAKRADWSPQEVAVLAVVYTSLRNGETTRDEEFPPLTAPVTGAEITRRSDTPGNPGSGGTREPQQPPATSEPDAPPAEGTLDGIYELAASLGWTEADLEQHFATAHDETPLVQATEAQLVAYRATLEQIGAQT